MDKETEDLTRFGSSWGSELCQAIHQDENKHDRALRLYQCPGGALLGWLFDEARLRQQTLDELAENLGVTPGYLMQISRGLRPTSQISQALTVACARYLGVAPVVIKLVSGSLSMTDFTVGFSSSESELPALDVLRNCRTWSAGCSEPRWSLMSRSLRRFTDIAIRQSCVRFNMIEITLSPESVIFFQRSRKV
jgi:transcriptional regulator with XRE-family HTH domain